jgi:hypothetical protein
MEYPRRREEHENVPKMSTGKEEVKGEGEREINAI